MSVIRESTDPVRSAFSAMPVQSRIIGLGLVLMVFGALAYMASGTGKADTEYLFGGRSLSEQELDSVEMSFSGAGLNDWKREGRRISVPAQSRSQYLAALQKSTSLPVSMRSSVQDAIDKTTIFESSSQRIAREMHAKEQDLGSKLSAFPEIRWASVDHDVSERQGLGRTRKQSASVVIYPEGGECLPISRVQMIREFVRGSYAGMTAEDVVVIDTNANANCLTSDPWHREKLEVEAQLELEVRKLLRDYGDIRVATSVDLQRPDAVSRRIENSIENDPVVAPSSGITQIHGSRSTKLSDPVENHEGGLIPPLVGLKSTFLAANTIRNLRVSVGLPESHYHRVWRQAYLRQHPGATTVPSFTIDQLQQLRDQTRRNIQSAIMPAMHGIASQSNDAALEVWDFPDVLHDESLAINYQAQAMTWLSNNWQQSAMVFLALIGLCVAAVVLRSDAPKPITARQTSVSFPGDVLQSGNADRPLDPISVGLNDRQRDSQSIGDAELLALVETHPSAAVEVIRDWISKAA